MSSMSGDLVQLNNPAEKALDIAAIRERLANKGGQEFWRGLEELADTPEFQDFLDNEFPQTGSDWRKPLDRRNILKLMGASLGLAGLTACTRQPIEKMVPYVKAPEDFSNNVAVYFATANVLGGYAKGALITSYQGRPTKAEGNPQHPSSLGGTDIHTQAALLGMWDPDRSQSVVHEGRISNTSAFWAGLTVLREQHTPNKGAGLRILTETITSPSLTDMIRTLTSAEIMPQAKWHVWDPITSDGARIGARLAFGEPVSYHYNIEPANVIVSLDSDFLNFGPGSVRYANDFAARRRPEEGKKRMNRFYVAEVTPTVTSVLSDHRYAAKSAEVEGIARSIAAKLGVAVDAPGGGAYDAWVTTVVKDLQANQGASLVVAGDHQPPIVHALAHAINEKLGNAGKTIIYTEPLEGEPTPHVESLKALIDDMNAGKVDTLIVLSGNPVYSAPADMGFRDAYLKVKNRVHLGLYKDETAEVSHWHVPEAHTLEIWGDARAHDGTITTIQPLIDPIYGGRTSLEIIGVLLGKQGTNFQTWKKYWRDRLKVKDFEAQLQKALHDGFWENTAPAPKTVAVKGDLKSVPPAAAPTGIEITFRLDPSVLDGRFANNAWLQELPKPISKVVWDNAIHLGPATAEKLGVTTDDLVEIKLRGKTVQMAVWVTPGQTKDTATITVGYGRKRAGKVGNDIGFDVSPIRTTQGWWSDSGADIRKASGVYKLVSTQTHHGIQQIKDSDAEQLNRHLVRVGTEEEYLKTPEFAKHMGEDPPDGLSLYPLHPYNELKWGMSIDLNSCTGCQTCVIACQAENNISVVGKDEVVRGREMHWMRIDRYHKGDIDNPAAYSQPITCMHCENAPCEPVCPVAATVHGGDGINQMVYNRCVGTRYCSNNCPYKVRRFNFFLYADWDTQSLHGLRNPEVTVRSRGVMEKCSYCVQRISSARIASKREDRPIKDGEVVTACQQACPTKAIMFGDLNDKESKIAKWKADPRSYGILTDLNTRPRTTYMARLENPNPELVKG